MSKLTAAGASFLSLLLTSSTWASDAPCTPPAPTPVVGIDIGNAPHVRRRVEALAGQVTYLRYVFTTSIKTGFFDTTSEAQALLQEVTASDALGDFDRLPGKRHSKRSRT